MEEPETRLHPAGIRQAATVLLAAVANQTQVILSTHSLELIDAIIEQSSDEQLSKLAVYQLRLDRNRLRWSRIDGPSVRAMRTELERDLR